MEINTKFHPEFLPDQDETEKFQFLRVVGGIFKNIVTTSLSWRLQIDIKGCDMWLVILFSPQCTHGQKASSL